MYVLGYIVVVACISLFLRGVRVNDTNQPTNQPTNLLHICLYSRDTFDTDVPSQVDPYSR